jgi:hypothetical protein
MPAANWPHGLSMVCQHDGSGWRPLADCSVSGDAAEANARLIAAAPEMLQALRKAVVLLAGACVHAPELQADDAYEAVSAAIAKATGCAA